MSGEDDDPEASTAGPAKRADLRPVAAAPRPARARTFLGAMVESFTRRRALEERERANRAEENWVNSERDLAKAYVDREVAMRRFDLIDDIAETEANEIWQKRSASIRDLDAEERRNIEEQLSREEVQGRLARHQKQQEIEALRQEIELRQLQKQLENLEDPPEVPEPEPELSPREKLKKIRAEIAELEARWDEEKAKPGFTEAQDRMFEQELNMLLDEAEAIEAGLS